MARLPCGVTLVDPTRLVEKHVPAEDHTNLLVKRRRKSYKAAESLKSAAIHNAQALKSLPELRELFVGMSVQSFFGINARV